VNIDIRKSFEKDAVKLPAAIQVQLAKLIEKMAAVNKLSELPSCKKLTGFKTAYRIRLGGYRQVSFLKIKQ
jgi:mRNA interferase RelE/StbE